MMCAVSLPVTLSLYRSLPTLSIIHVYYSCRISRHAHNGLALRTGRPVILTVNGKADAVLMDAKTFETRLAAGNLARLLAPAEKDVRSGRTRPVRSFLREFKVARKIPR